MIDVDSEQKLSQSSFYPGVLSDIISLYQQRADNLWRLNPVSILGFFLTGLGITGPEFGATWSQSSFYPGVLSDSTSFKKQFKGQ